MQTRSKLPKRRIRIEGERVALRPLTLEHATEAYASWINDPEVNRYLDTHSTTVPKLRAYIGKFLEHDSALLLGIFWKENGAHIGNVKLEPIRWEEGDAMLGMIVGDKAYWGRGVATEATDLVTAYAFRALCLRSVFLGVHPAHAAAIRVYEKCGFAFERIEKDAINPCNIRAGSMAMRRNTPPPPSSAP